MWDDFELDSFFFSLVKKVLAIIISSMFFLFFSSINLIMYKTNLAQTSKSIAQFLKKIKRF